MNHYEPKRELNAQGIATGNWVMTFTNMQTFTIGFCRHGKCNHKTPGEASDCYRRYALQNCNGLIAGYPMCEKWGTPLNVIEP